MSLYRNERFQKWNFPNINRPKIKLSKNEPIKNKTCPKKKLSKNEPVQKGACP